MTRVELEDATGSLSDYTRQARKGPVVVTRKGRPVALLRLLGEDEWEDFVVGTSPVFRRILKRSEASYKAEGGIPWRRSSGSSAFRPGRGSDANRGVRVSEAGSS